MNVEYISQLLEQRMPKYLAAADKIVETDGFTSTGLRTGSLLTNREVPNYLTEKGMMYTYLNPVSYLTALKEKALFGMMDGIFADGGLLVKAIRLVYGVKVTRRSFDMTSMAPEVLAYANEHGMSV